MDLLGETGDGILDALQVFYKVDGQAVLLAERADDQRFLVGSVVVDELCWDGGENECNGHLGPPLRRVSQSTRAHARRLVP